MYRHILIATDGSTLAEKAVDSGTKLAAALGAKLTVAHVGAPYAPPLYAGDFVPSTFLSSEEHEARVKEAARWRISSAAAFTRASCSSDDRKVLGTKKPAYSGGA